MKSSWERSR